VQNVKIEAKKVTLEAARINGPVYLRFTRDKTPIITVVINEFPIKSLFVPFSKWYAAYTRPIEDIIDPTQTIPNKFASVFTLILKIFT